MTTRVTSEAVAVEWLFDAMTEVMEVVVGIVVAICCSCTDDAELLEVTTEVFDCNAVVLLFADEVVAITAAALATLVVGAEDDEEGGLSLVHISATHWAQGRAAYIGYNIYIYIIQGTIYAMIFCLVLNTKQELEYHRKLDKIPTYIYIVQTF